LDIDSGDTKSPTSYYVLTLGGGTISWKSAKQNVVSWYTMGAKFLVVIILVLLTHIFIIYVIYHY